MRTRSTDLREQRIARQIEVVLAQEGALDRRREELREREDRLARREQEFEQRRRELVLDWGRRTADIDERERAVGEQEALVAGRSTALEETARRKARSLAEETVSLAERNRDVAWRAKAVEEAFPAPPPVEPVAAPVGEETAEIMLDPPAPHGGWNLDRIERLVQEYSAANPARVDEWRYYLLYLREFAEADGALPRSFDWLVWDAFGDLLAQIPAEPAPA